MAQRVRPRSLANPASCTAALIARCTTKLVQVELATLPSTASQVTNRVISGAPISDGGRLL